MAKQMAEQGNDATQYPLFVIKQKVKVYGESDWSSESERIPDGEGDLCERCQKLEDENMDLPEFCYDCPSTLFAHFNWADETVDEVGVFFTKRAAKEHIRTNYYNYNQPFVFCTGAWRNPEMHKVMRWIFELAGVPMPNYYK